MGSETSMIGSSAIQLKRAYEPHQASDGVRVLVDRLWARGVSKDSADLDAWMKELGPSDELRKWFGHQSDRWNMFVEKYRDELATPLRQLLLAELQGVARESVVTLVYGARDTKENEAVVLRQYLLHDTAHPDDTLDAPTKALITVAVVAAAHHDAIAPTPSLTLFAPPILTARELDGALKELLTNGQLRECSDGWKVTPRGQRRIEACWHGRRS